MNSLNILSARVSPPQTPSPSRNTSFADVLNASISEKRRSSRSEGLEKEKLAHDAEDDLANDADSDEKTPLLEKADSSVPSSKTSSWRLIPNRIANALIESLRWLLSTLAAPGFYLIGLLYDERGQFAPLSRLGLVRDSPGPPSAEPSYFDDSGLVARAPGKATSSRRNTTRSNRNMAPSSSSSSGLSSDSESERVRLRNTQRDLDSPARNTRSKSAASGDEIAPARRSIRIKLHNEDTLRQRRQRKSQSPSSQSNGSGATSESSAISPATLKSPTSPSSLLMTKYPRAPAPPRPLLPRRQPCYSPIPDAMPGGLTQKTLIIDLDETLIHSMAKGGRMSTGHMVEVKLNTIVGVNAGPQHPILYYVHKRPHCDDFLRRVCKWYNLVVFTASVQEYADPVIDWLEQERKFFSGRYYRQHCTYRHGAFIKDLTSVEPDLSKVMILDNSPLSYMFHQDNAIPIEGWINDPTDNDLLHLMPLLEGLQYVTDVRALLALRGGEDGKHM